MIISGGIQAIFCPHLLQNFASPRTNAEQFGHTFCGVVGWIVGEVGATDKPVLMVCQAGSCGVEVMEGFPDGLTFEKPAIRIRANSSPNLSKEGGLIADGTSFLPIVTYPAK